MQRERTIRREEVEDMERGRVFDEACSQRRLEGIESDPGLDLERRVHSLRFSWGDEGKVGSFAGLQIQTKMSKKKINRVLIS